MKNKHGRDAGSIHFAKAVMLATKLREDSYVSKTPTVLRISGEEMRFPNGHYKLTEEEACVKACEQTGVPYEMWYVLHLAMHWCNDLHDWAKSVLDGTVRKQYRLTKPRKIKRKR